MRVKICGIRTIEAALCAQRFGADAIGFVFAKSARQITPKNASKIVRKLGPFVSRVGVFVNAPEKTLIETAQICGLDTLQLHGQETRAQIQRLQKRGLRVIKAFRIQSKADLVIIRNCRADAILLDSAVSGAQGGTGIQFNWNLLNFLKIKKPVIVSGGLSAGNLGGLFNIFKPYGVDVSSGVEKKPGVKDLTLIKKFIEYAKKNH